MLNKMGLGGLVRNVVLGAGMLAASVGCDNQFTLMKKNMDKSRVDISEFSHVVQKDVVKVGQGCHGVLLDDDKVLTAEHCVRKYKDKSDVKIGLGNGLSCNVKDIATHSNEDIARVTCKNKLKKSNIGIGSSYKLKVGDSVYICVFDDKYNFQNIFRNGNTTTFAQDKKQGKYCLAGEVLELYENAIKTSVNGRAGYSGSGLFDSRGDLVGILHGGDGVHTNHKMYFVGGGSRNYGTISNHTRIEKLEDNE
jgi:S1-C subfamily serine protease